MRHLKLIIIGIAFGLPISNYSQLPGSLDVSFDGDGKVTAEISGCDLQAYDVIVQPDGKILVAGEYLSITSNRDFALFRYNSDGSLDNTFDGDGIVTTDFGGMFDVGLSLKVQIDGKIVVGGYSNSSGTYDFALARYNIDGSLDNTFDLDGKVTTDFGGAIDYGRDIEIQADGKILVAGSSNNPGNYDFAIARYNIDGSLDNSFDSDAKVTTDFGDIDNGFSIVLQADGKIIIGGSTGDGTINNFAISRLNADGSLDNSFDSDGKVTTDFNGSDDQGRDLALQSDGKIVAVGYSTNGVTDYGFALVRYTSTGSLDNTFDGDGKQTTNFTARAYGNAVAIQVDGKIVIGGETYDSPIKRFGVARYNNDGTLDNTFDTDGKLTTDFVSPGMYTQGNAVAMQPDGKIVVAGRTQTTNGALAIARYLSGLNIGIDNESLIPELSIYPNPVNKELNIEYFLSTSVGIKIFLVSWEGKIMGNLFQSDHQIAGKYNQTLMLPENLASGYYNVVICSGEFISSVKIIVQ